MIKPLDIDKQVGSAIMARRVLMGMSQQVLGRAIGVTFQQIQKYEKGRNQLSLRRAYQLSKALGISLNALLTESLGGAAHECSFSDRRILEMMKRFCALDERQQDAIGAFIKTLAQE